MNSVLKADTVGDLLEQPEDIPGLALSVRIESPPNHSGTTRTRRFRSRCHVARAVLAGVLD
jgi:hypothetical protein